VFVAALPLEHTAGSADGAGRAHGLGGETKGPRRGGQPASFETSSSRRIRSAASPVGRVTRSC